MTAFSKQFRSKARKQFNRTLICDLDCENFPGPQSADFFEISRVSPTDPEFDEDGMFGGGSDSEQKAGIRSSAAGNQKLGTLALAWRDYMGGEDNGAWTVPAVIGVRFDEPAKERTIVAIRRWTDDGQPVVGEVAERGDLPIGIVLRDVAQGSQSAAAGRSNADDSELYGVIAVRGMYWFKGGGDVGDDLVTAAWEGGNRNYLDVVADLEEPTGKPWMHDKDDAPMAGAINFSRPVYRVLGKHSDGDMMLVEVVVGNPGELFTSNAWDNWNNTISGQDPSHYAGTPVWGHSNAFGLLDQAFVVEPKDDGYNYDDEFESSVEGGKNKPVETHLSLRRGVRLYHNAMRKGPIRTVPRPPPPDWMVLPIFWGRGLGGAFEAGAWTVAIPPPPTITPTPGIPDGEDPDLDDDDKPSQTTPSDNPKEKPPPAYTVTAVDAWGGKGQPKDPLSSGGKGPGDNTWAGEVKDLKKDLKARFDLLMDLVKGLQDSIFALQDDILSILEALDALAELLSDLVDKILALQEDVAEIQKQKKTGDTPAGSPAGDSSTPAAAGGGGGGDDSDSNNNTFPATSQPPDSGISEPTGPLGGAHAGGEGGIKTLSIFPAGCGSIDKDPRLDESLCASSVDPDPFPSFNSGAEESIPGTVAPETAGGILAHFLAGDDSGPTYNVVADRAGQTWTTQPGASCMMKLDWNPETGQYEADPFQSTVKPVTPVSQTENFVASLASGGGAEINRHGQIVEYGSLTGVGVAAVDEHSANYTVDEDDRGKLLAVDATSGNVTMSLPAIADVPEGFTVAVKKVDSSSNSVILDPDGSETIEGSAQLSMATEDQTVTVTSDGSEWLVVADTGSAAGGGTYQLLSEKGAASGYPGLDTNQVVEEEVAKLETGLLAARDVTGVNGQVYFATDDGGGEVSVWYP